MPLEKVDAFDFEMLGPLVGIRLDSGSESEDEFMSVEEIRAVLGGSKILSIGGGSGRIVDWSCTTRYFCRPDHLQAIVALTLRKRSSKAVHSCYLLKLRSIRAKNIHSRELWRELLNAFTSASAKVVLRLMKGFLHKGHCLFMDNFYNSLRLARFLKFNKTDVVGTLNRRRIGTPGEIKTLLENKVPRGAVTSRHCGDVSVLSWKDVRLVTTVSTFHNANMMPGRRAGRPILKPVVVHDYNKYMGGVDLKIKCFMYLWSEKGG
ncbi:unnamed protein product [Leptosia nina]|uniref:PiggyBac transposable element-derived protein domain-containing protein n=1 Tax=Leptosia nina TaxID=320188 RepID=A0AAV1IVJ4_9NEOP